MTLARDDRRAATRALPGQVERDAPSAALTTYRCGGPLAALVRAEHRGRPRCASPTSRATDVPVLVIGRGSNLLVADAGFAGVAIVLAGDVRTARRRSTAERVAIAGGARSRCRSSPAGPRRRASAASSSSSGSPASVGGAVRMNAGGHGRETERRARRRPGVLASTTATSATLAPRRARPRLPALGARRRVPSCSPRRSPGTPTIPPSVRGAHRRDRALAPRAPARRPERGLGVHQPARRRRRPAHRGRAAARACASAGAVVSEKHANFFVAEPGRDRRPTSHALVARSARRRWPPERASTSSPSSHLVGFRDRRGSPTMTADDRPTHPRASHRGATRGRPQAPAASRSRSWPSCVALGLAFLAVRVAGARRRPHPRRRARRRSIAAAVEQAAGVETGRAAAARRHRARSQRASSGCRGSPTPRSSRELPGHVAHHRDRTCTPVAYVRRDDARVALARRRRHRDRRQRRAAAGRDRSARRARACPRPAARLAPAGAAGVVRPRCRPSSRARVGAVDLDRRRASTLVLDGGGEVRLVRRRPTSRPKGAAALAVLQRLGDRAVRVHRRVRPAVARREVSGTE